MNNNQINFDPITGQPINQNVNNTVVPQPEIIQPVPTVEQVPTVEPVQTIQPQVPIIDSNIYNQQQMQSIPTVEQTKQDFINNTQANSVVEKEEKKEGPNITFIIILFVIIFAAIFFLFPYLLKILN